MKVPEVFKWFKSFFEYLNNMTDIYKIIEEYNPNKEQKTFVVVGDVIVDIPRNNPALSKVVTNKSN